MDSPISWEPVHHFVGRLLAGRSTAILPGTPEWCALDDNDPRKTVALLIAADRWALDQERLHLEHQRIAAKDAALQISAEKDWAAVARQIRERNDFYNTHPDLRRRAS